MNDVSRAEIQRVADALNGDVGAAIDLIGRTGSASNALRSAATTAPPKIIRIEMEDNTEVYGDAIEPLAVVEGPGKKWSIVFVPLGKRFALTKTYRKAMVAMRWLLAKYDWAEADTEKLKVALLQAAEFGVIER